MATIPIYVCQDEFDFELSAILSMLADDKKIAQDSTVRETSKDGHLRIGLSHISKACVNPYKGSEIPGAAELGLDPEKVYYLLRSPEELKKAAPTFIGKPILSKHVPISSRKHPHELVVGSIGSDVEFNDPYLDADTSIWTDRAIAGIETDAVREFSCGYAYKAVMTPGVFKGEKYDGVMTEIVGNHLAIVENGRAGSDVVAADSNPFKKVEKMATTKLGKALVVVLGAVSPKLAQDSALPALLGNAVRKNFDRLGMTAKIIAMDAELKEDKVKAVMDAVLDNEDEPEAKEPAKDKKAKDSKRIGRDAQSGEERAMWAQMRKDGTADDPADDSMPASLRTAADADDETDEERKERLAKRAADKKAKDADPEERIEKAMDELKAEMKAANAARVAVRSTVGDVMGLDSAAEIYGFGLDHLKVDHAGVSDVKALEKLFKVATEKNSTAAPRIALDSAIVARFPHLNRVRQM